MTKADDNYEKHFRAAESMQDGAEENGDTHQEVPLLLHAQVHAILALAAAVRSLEETMASVR